MAKKKAKKSSTPAESPKGDSCGKWGKCPVTGCWSKKSIWGCLLIAVSLWLLASGFFAQQAGLRWNALAWYFVGALLMFSGKMWLCRACCE